jgi:uncharacterized protein DUF397
MTNPDEVTPWVTASDSSGTCVRMRRNGDRIEIGDTKTPDQVLSFTQAEIDVFLAGVDSKVFDQFRTL